MRRLVLVLSAFLLVGSARADMTNDVSEIRSRLEAIRNYLQATQENRLSQILNNVLSIEDDIAYIWENLLQNLAVDDTGALSVRDEGAITVLNNLLYSLSDDIFPAILDIQTVLGSGDITSEILNLNALLQSISSASSLIWSILDTAEDGGLIRTDPDYSGLQSILQNLGVSVSNFSDLLEELEDWHPDITGEVTATLDGPVVIGEMPDVNVDLSDVDFSYFDDWRDNVGDLFSSDYLSSHVSKTFSWSNNAQWGKAKPGDLSYSPVDMSGDWFRGVLSLLQNLDDNLVALDRGALEIFARMPLSTNDANIVSDANNSMNALSREVSELEGLTPFSSQISQKFTTIPRPVRNYAQFNILKSTYSGHNSISTTFDFDLGTFRFGQGQTMIFSGSIDITNHKPLFDTMHKASAIVYWMMTFVLSVMFSFILVRGVKQIGWALVSPKQGILL